MIYRLRYCNKDGVEARVDIQKGLATPVIEVEGTEQPFVLSYNNDKGNKSGMFLSSSADIEIYETTDFNIDNLKTSNETELSVTHYINNVISWQGFIIPDFFSIEVRNNPVITMTASDRLGTLKNVTLSDLPSMISLRELAILCLDKTGLTLPLRTMADFNNGTGVNDFFNSKILTQRLSDTKGRSISCYDILSSILTASNSFLVQRSGGWHIINKIQHEAGSGKLYTGATSFINWSDVIFNFSDISAGGRRTIIPVASTVGVFHEFGGGLIYPENYDFSLDLTGWTSVNGFVAVIDNRKVDNFVSGTGVIPQEWTTDPVFGEPTEKKYLVNDNYGINYDFANKPYLRSSNIPVTYPNISQVKVNVEVNATGPYIDSETYRGETNFAVIASDGTSTLHLTGSGTFEALSGDPFLHKVLFDGDTHLQAVTSSRSVNGVLAVQDGNLSGYDITVRIYGYTKGVTGGRFLVTTLVNSVAVTITDISDEAKGTLYKTERTDNYTKAHDINTSLFADYLTTGLNGYFYDYSIDDTSSLYNSANELTSKWTAYNDPEQLPLLQHVTRQRSRLFSVAHDLLSAEIEVNDFDPLAIFVACEKRYTVVSAQFDFFKSNLSVELEEVAFQNAAVRDFIYSYFGDGESGIKSIGGISGGGGTSGGGGLTPEQIEVLSWWKKDPDNPDTIFTEMNAYSTKELSAYGTGDGGGGGGSDYERLDTWASYDSSKAEWVLSAFLGNDLNTRVTAIDGRVTDLENSGGGGIIETVYGYGNLGQTFNNSILTDTFNAYTINQINTRLVAVESGSATTVNTTGTGNAITSISKSGSVITASKDLTFSLSNHLHTGVYLPLTGGTMANTNLVTNLNADLLDGKYGYQYRGEVSLPYVYDFQQVVIGLVNLDNSNTERQSWSSGQLYANRPNGSGWGAVVVNYSLQKRHNSVNMYAYLNSTLSGIELCTFTYNGTKYGGIRFFPSITQVYGGLRLYGRWSDVEPFMIAYRDNSGVLNSEVDNSIIINGSDIEEQRLRTGSNIYAFTSDNVASATKLQTARTIAGVSFDGTANIAIPFANLSSKPTTLGEYGITDAVTLNTAQTITGAKTFSSNLYTTADLTADTGITIAQDEGTGVGLSLFGVAGTNRSTNPDFGLMFARTANKGTHGSVTGDWATYFTMTATAGRGWIFTNNPAGTTGNVASIDNTGGMTIKNLTLTAQGTGVDASEIVFTRPTYNYIRATGTGGINFCVNNDNPASLNSVLVLAPNGNVGIGKGFTNNTTSITAQLHVRGDILATGTTTTTKVIFNAAGWSMEQVGSELQMKHNNVLKMRFTSTGSIVATEEITAFA